MPAFTKQASDVFSGLNDSNNSISVSNSEAATWGAEVEAYLDGVRFYQNSVSDLLADMDLTYTTGSVNTAKAGDVLNVRDQNFIYKIAESDATDHHIATAGGVKLYVLQGENRTSVKAFGAVGDYANGSGTDDTAAIQKALDTGWSIVFPKGRYLVSEELYVTTAAQEIVFETTAGYAYGEDIGENWQHGTQLVANSTFTKRIRTRRKFRGSASDAEDDAISVVLNIQAEGVILHNPGVWLECDYTDASPTNYGADVDVGIFIGTRVGTQVYNPIVIGYFRNASFYIDITNQTGLARFSDPDGNLYPTGTVENGSDGTHIHNPYFRGGRVGLAVLGASPKSGEIDYTDAYYDEVLGSTVSDSRGSFGCSDMLVFGGRIYGPDHHSDRRLHDPNSGSGALSSATLIAEPDNAPSAVHIDGLAGNSSTNIWGMRFYGTRIATFEAFRVRLGKASRVSFIGAHIEGRSLSRMNTNGTVINTNDYTDHSYGDISGIPGDGSGGGDTDRITVFGSPKQSYSDGLAPHFYGEKKPFLTTDSGRLYGIDYIEADDDINLRCATGSVVRLREGTSTSATVAVGRLSVSDGEIYSGQLTIDDDSVGSITPPFLGGLISITAMGSGGDFPSMANSGLVRYDTGSSLSQQKESAGGANLDSQTSNVTGTSGTDGNTTVAIRSSEIKIENRTGGSMVYKYSFLA